MKLSNTPMAALLALAGAIFPSVAVAMTRDQVPSIRNARFRAAPPGDAATVAPGVQNATFEQLIDHENPHLGTFSQFYYYSTEFYKGPGSPVVRSSVPQLARRFARKCFKYANRFPLQVFFTPGEIAILGYDRLGTPLQFPGYVLISVRTAMRPHLEPLVLLHRNLAQLSLSLSTDTGAFRLLTSN